jgi:hypothetical protein
MNNLWWLGLGLMLLPLWWHRQKRQSTKAVPLATARFLPRAEPKQRRVWRWVEIFLLLLRCLLLAAVTAWLADMVVAWRGDMHLLPSKENAGDPLRWFAAHEREFKKDARIAIGGDAAMPAVAPRVSHGVTLKTSPVAKMPPTRNVYIESQQRERWASLFAAADGPVRYVIDAAPGPATSLVVWDSDAEPPPQLRAKLWWTSKPPAAAVPARSIAWEGLSLVISQPPRGRTWHLSPVLPASVDQARAMFSAWEYLEYGAPAHVAPPGALALTSHAAAVQPLPVEPAPGPLRAYLAWLVLTLFALERIFAHAGKR